MSTIELLSLCLFVLQFVYNGTVFATPLACKKLSLLDLMIKDKCPIVFVLHSFKSWKFNQKQVLASSFALDPIPQNYVRQVPNCLFSVTYPVPLNSQTYVVSYSNSVLLDILDLSEDAATSSEFVEFVSGSKILSGSVPLSHRYGGHQFGYWSGQLGDGRAVMLGEYTNQRGDTWELQLKGSGRTPYSRHGDGRAVLRSSVREFLCSEAMFRLGM
jgi:uncharacterized protein YdiU (UPF0061 family)